MPMLIKIVELDFSWPSFNSGLHWVALGLKKFLPLQEQIMIFTLLPTKVQCGVINIANY